MNKSNYVDLETLVPFIQFNNFNGNNNNANNISFNQSIVHDCKHFHFVIWGCIGLIICCFGYLGNFLSILVFSKDSRNSATILLQSLAISDLVLLMSVTITDAVPYICDYTEYCTNLWVTWPYIRYIWILTPTAHMCSIWLVVLVAANRYWAVCKPYHASEAWTNNKTTIYLAFVVLAAILFNVPRFFEYKIEELNIYDSSVHNYKNSVFEIHANNNSMLNNSSLVYLERLKDGNWNLHPNYISKYENNNFENPIYTVFPIKKQISLIKMTKYAYNVILIQNNVSPSTGIIRNDNEDKLNFKSKTEKQYNWSYSDDANHNLRNHKNYTDYLETSSLNVNRDNMPLKEITSHFGLHKLYKVGYKVILVNIILILLPLLYLLVTSVWIIKSLEAAAKRRKSYNKRQGTIVSQESCRVNSGYKKVDKGSIKKNTPSKEVTFLLVTVVLVSVACQTPLAVFHFVRYLYIYRCGGIVFYLESASKLLVNLNCCVNFIIYCLLSPKFRRILVQLFSCGSVKDYPGPNLRELNKRVINKNINDVNEINGETSLLPIELKTANEIINEHIKEIEQPLISHVI